MQLLESHYFINGVPWGLGAIKVEMPEHDWICPAHNGRAGKGAERHVYENGDIACTDCARLLIKGITPAPVYGQLSFG